MKVDEPKLFEMSEDKLIRHLGNLLHLEDYEGTKEQNVLIGRNPSVFASRCGHSFSEGEARAIEDFTDTMEALTGQDRVFSLSNGGACSLRNNASVSALFATSEQENFATTFLKSLLPELQNNPTCSNKKLLLFIGQCYRISCIVGR